jgi:hypothetical protein
VCALIISFLKMSHLDKMDFLCYLGGVWFVATRNSSLWRDFSFSIIVLSFLVVCICNSVLSRLGYESIA